MADNVGAESRPEGAGAGPSENSSSPLRAIIKNVDMSDEMQQLTVDIASDAMEKFKVEKDIAAHVKREMDRKCGPTWHTVVGANCESSSRGSCVEQ